jgi:hypothetical protein
MPLFLELFIHLCHEIIADLAGLERTVDSHEMALHLSLKSQYYQTRCARLPSWFGQWGLLVEA